MLFKLFDSIVTSVPNRNYTSCFNPTSLYVGVFLSNTECIEKKRQTFPLLLILTAKFSVSIKNTKFACLFLILTANFPVRIDKRKVCMIVLKLTGMFSVSIKKVETN